MRRKKTPNNYTGNLSPQKATVELRVLEIDPAKVDIVVKVQEELNGSSGILREGTLAYTLAGRDKRLDDKKMRDSTISYHDHISRFEDNDQASRKVLGFVGNGNLLMNPWFVAWVDGILFYLKNEPVGQREYSSLVVWKDKRVSIENVYFRGGRINLDDPQKGEDVTEKVIYTTYGQRLKKRCDFVPPVEIANQYYDLRHLLLFPFLSDKEGYFGLNQLETDSKKRKRALKKSPVHLDFKGDKDKVRKALSEKGYEQVEEVEQEGQYHISGDKICITFKSGLFPHNVIGVAKDGKVISIVVTGWSNTAGLMLDKADSMFKDIESRHGICVEDAILLDNGGDVMMQCRGEMVAHSFMSPPRERLRSVILFVALPSTEEGIRLLEV